MAIFRLCLSILLILMSSAKSWAGDLPTSISVVTEEMPPFNYTDPASGKVTGLSTEIVQAVLDKLGVKGNFRSQPWARSERDAMAAENVLIYSISKNETRRDKFKWIGKISQGRNFFYAMAGRQIRLADLDAAKNYRVGVVNEDIRELYFRQHGFAPATLEAATAHGLNYAKLKAGRIDLWPIEEHIMAYFVHQAGDDPNSLQPLLEIADLSGEGDGDFMAFGPKTSDEVVEAFRSALEALKTSGQFDAIQKKWAS